MFRKWFRRGIPLALVLGMLNIVLFTHITGAQQDYPLENCRANGFSTEEDFMMQRGEPYDGNPYISDGDLLNFNGQVCARNADLLRNFDVRVDLGLDGVDVLDADKRIVAFSTELDSPFGTFTAGDVLITNGGIIPNLALVFPFGIDYNIGLDEVKFMGKIEDIIRFVEFVRENGPDSLLEGKLQSVMQEFNIDIWFTIEGTFERDQRLILDGDLLSASGSVIRTQADLFVAAIPAGIPQRGVDFGLDAFAVNREAHLSDGRFRMYLSTEILYRGRPVFSDGDILRLGGTVARTNEALMAPFAPAARFLGLDALYLNFRPVITDPNITHLCGRSEALFDDGTGLYQDSTTQPDGDEIIVPRPCGMYVPIDGYLPAGAVKRFRVAYREVSEPVPAIGTGPAIQTKWILNDRDNILLSCILNPTHTLSTDGGGWMDAAEYLGAWNGDANTDFCPNPEVRLAVWNTLSLPAGSIAGHDREDHFIVWLEWEDTGGVLHREADEHHVQLDNTAPDIPAYPDGLQVRLPDGVTVVPACGEAPTGASDLQVWADFDDRYYESFQVILRGGSPPATVAYDLHHYYDDVGVPPEFQNTDDTGTTPDGTLVHVQDIDMTDLGDSYDDCCYILELWAHDRAILHTFNGSAVNQVNSHYDYTFITFSASP
jgi:hypothetical protein